MWKLVARASLKECSLRLSGTFSTCPQQPCPVYESLWVPSVLGKKWRCRQTLWNVCGVTQSVMKKQDESIFACRVYTCKWNETQNMFAYNLIKLLDNSKFADEKGSPQVRNETVLMTNRTKEELILLLAQIAHLTLTLSFSFTASSTSCGYYYSNLKFQATFLTFRHCPHNAQYTAASNQKQLLITAFTKNLKKTYNVKVCVE